MLLLSSRISVTGCENQRSTARFIKQVAEDEHEGDGNQADQHRSPQHAGAQTGAHDAAALIGVELEHIADEQNQDRDEEKKRDDRQAGEDDDLLRGGWVEEAAC